MRDIQSRRTVNDDKTVAGAQEFATSQMQQKQHLTFVFTDVQSVDSDNAVTRQMLDMINSAVDQGGTICVVTHGEIWTRLQRAGMSLILDAPNEDEMKTIISEFVEQYRSSVPCEWGAEEVKQVAIIMAGFTQLEAENQLLLLVVKGSILKADVHVLAQAKDRMFANISGLERVPLPETLPVGGLVGLNTWLERQEPLLSMDLCERGLRPPRGVLLVGVPGCGKSLTAKAVAARWKMALYRLDLANIHGQYLGQSESRLKEALATADRLAPCVLWIDEIEKGLAGGGDGGTSTRLVGHFLYWLQEGLARVFVVSTANDVSKLPAELFRRGRFDELFFVDLPNVPERQDIIGLYAKRYLQLTLDSGLLKELATISDGFAGSDLEAATSEVAKLVLMGGGTPDDFALWRRVFSNVIPLSQTNPEQIESIRTWGRERAVPASGQPIGGSANAPGKTGRPLLGRQVLA
jgi:ATPase family associated with various cellular activities (AAA)